MAYEDGGNGMPAGSWYGVDTEGIEGTTDGVFTMDSSEVSDPASMSRSWALPISEGICASSVVEQIDAVIYSVDPCGVEQIDAVAYSVDSCGVEQIDAVTYSVDSCGVEQIDAVTYSDDPSSGIPSSESDGIVGKDSYEAVE